MGRDVRNSLTFYLCLAHDDIIMVSVCGWDVILYKISIHIAASPAMYSIRVNVNYYVFALSPFLS